jgi:hypothetical protein
MDRAVHALLRSIRWGLGKTKAGLMNAQFGTPGDDKEAGPGGGRGWKFLLFLVFVAVVIGALIYFR